MRPSEAGHRPELPWGLLASALLHVLLVVLLVFLPQPPPIEPLVEHSIDVEIVTAAPPEPRPGDSPQAATPPTPSTLPPAPGTTARPLPPAMVRATQLLSAKSLADPRSQEARATLSQLAQADRVELLCNAEAMEQVHAWKQAFEPDWVVAYALAETSTTGTTLTADGAAFHSNRQWYKLKFRCELAPHLDKVTAFEFLVGDAVPRNQWAAHNLPVLH